MTREEAAYIAGFFDGEGSIGLYRRKTPVGHDCFLYLVNFAQKQPAILHQIKNILGLGAVRKKSVDQHGLTINGRKNIIRVLEDLLPFLRVKKNQARWLMAACRISLVAHHSRSKLLTRSLNYFCDQIKENKSQDIAA